MYRSSPLLDGIHHTEASIYKCCSYKRKIAKMSYESKAHLTISCVSEHE
jgi:hypothetical protein